MKLLVNKMDDKICDMKGRRSWDIKSVDAMSFGKQVIPEINSEISDSVHHSAATEIRNQDHSRIT